MVKSDKPCVLAGNNEGRRLGVTGAGAEQPLIVGSDEQTNEKETKNVEAIPSVSGCVA